MHVLCNLNSTNVLTLLLCYFNCYFSGYSLLHYCCLFNLTSLVSKLIDRGADLNIKTRCNSTALHLAAGVYISSYFYMSDPFRQNLKVTLTRDSCCCTSLASGNGEVVSQLIEAGALVDLVNNNDMTASFAAVISLLLTKSTT